MKHRCPKCGHRFDDNAQAKAAKARWKATSKKDRSAAAKAAAEARWKTKKATRPQNAGDVARGGGKHSTQSKT